MFIELKGNSKDNDFAIISSLESFSYSDHIVELSKLKYAKFTVKSLLKYW